MALVLNSWGLLNYLIIVMKYCTKDNILLSVHQKVFYLIYIVDPRFHTHNTVITLKMIQYL